MRVDSIVAHKKLIIFGAGAKGQKLANAYKGKIAYFIDDNQADSRINDVPVFHSSVLNSEDREGVFIIIASDSKYEDFTNQLLEMGFVKNTHFLLYTAFFSTECLTEQFPIWNLNIFVSDICNSRCITCNIWKNEMDFEKGILPLDRYRKALSDPLFRNIRRLTITGGEPSLVENLPEYVKIAIGILPALCEVVITMNSILVERTISQIHEIANECACHGISLLASFSLTGMEDTHDKLRGVPGSYQKVKAVVRGIREMNLPNVSININANVGKENIWDLDEFALMLKREGWTQNTFQLYGRYSTLRNTGYEGLETFNEDEQYQLKLFYNKLMHVFPDEYKRMNYKCFLERFDGRKRLTDCGHELGQSLSISVTGGLKYCVVNCRDIGNSSYGDIHTIYKNSLPYLRGISRIACDHCYSRISSIFSNEKYIKFIQNEEYWNTLYTLNYFYTHHKMAIDALEFPNIRDNRHTVLLTGWYGTETVGDKAILGQILSEIREKDKDARILITSAYPFVTRRTLYELKEDVEVIPLWDKQSLQWAAMADEVVMAGGPLMEMDWLAIPLWLFSIARHWGHKTVLRGCGIGPLFSEKAEQAVCDILRLADEITLRDEASATWASERVGRTDIRVTGDPAVSYIRARYKQARNRKHSGELACFLRELTSEYLKGKTESEFIEYRTELEAALARNIKALCARENLIPHFYSMHNFVVGNDDRDFNFRFADTYFEKGTYKIDNKLTSIKKVTAAMNKADLCLCMRFHSVVFADTLEVPYLAFDYTYGWKIAAFMKEQGKCRQMARAEDLLKSENFLLGIGIMNSNDMIP